MSKQGILFSKAATAPPLISRCRGSIYLLPHNHSTEPVSSGALVEANIRVVTTTI